MKRERENSLEKVKIKGKEVMTVSEKKNENEILQIFEFGMEMAMGRFHITRPMPLYCEENPQLPRLFTGFDLENKSLPHLGPDRYLSP